MGHSSVVTHSNQRRSSLRKEAATAWTAKQRNYTGSNSEESVAGDVTYAPRRRLAEFAVQVHDADIMCAKVVSLHLRSVEAVEGQAREVNWIIPGDSSVQWVSSCHEGGVETLESSSIQVGRQ